MIVSRCCRLTGLGLGQGASPPSPTHHPCQSGTIELDHPSSPRLSPSNLQRAQLLGRGSQTPFLAPTLNFLCDLRGWLAFPRLISWAIEWALRAAKGQNSKLRFLSLCSGPFSKWDHRLAADPKGELEIKIQGLRGWGLYCHHGASVQFGHE